MSLKTRQQDNNISNKIFLKFVIGQAWEPRWLSDKESFCHAGDTGDVGSIPGSGSSSKGGNGNPFQYSSLEKSMDRGAWWATVHGVTKSQTGFSNWASILLNTSLVSSVAKLYPTLCDPMDCRTSSFPVHHQLQELSQTHVHRVGDAIQPSHPLPFPSPPAFKLSQHQGLFNESVLHIRWPKDWSFSFNISPSNEYSGLISFRMDWISFQSKGLSRVFPNTTVQKHQFFCA